MGNLDAFWATFADGDEERLLNIASVDPDVIKAVELSGKLDDLRRKREKANAFLHFCADAVKLVLAVKGIAV